MSELYPTEAEEDKALLRLMEERQKEERMSKEEQADFEKWLVHTVRGESKVSKRFPPKK